MPNRARVGIDFIVVSSLHFRRAPVIIEIFTTLGRDKCGTHLVGLVAEEMDRREAFILYVPECIRLVPSSGEDVEGYLSSN